MKVGCLETFDLEEVSNSHVWTDTETYLLSSTFKKVATPLSVLINVTSVGVCTFAFGRKKGVGEFPPLLSQLIYSLTLWTPYACPKNKSLTFSLSIAFPFSSIDGINDLHPTYFTPNSSLLGLYWAVLYFLMVGFSVLVVISRKKETKVSGIRDFLS